MKKIIMTLLCLSASALLVSAQDHKSVTGDMPVAKPQPVTGTSPIAGQFEFNEETHDFGKVPEGPDQEYDFTFKNSGKSAILIKEAHGSCGCTVPQWPKEPILPGENAAIHVTYHTNGRVGAINKDVIITSNALLPTMTLHIKGTVEPKSGDAEPVKRK